MRSDPFRLSPSLVSRYFFLECDRFLRFKAASRERGQAEGIPQGDFDHSALMRDVMASGLDWEEEVLETHLAGRVAIAPGDGALSERRFDATATLDMLRRLAPGSFLYQGTLHVPDAFYAEYGLSRDLVSFSDCHPDLIEILEGPEGRVLRIIDIKRGDTVQLLHRVQVLLYALMLDAVLEAHGVTDLRVDLAEGAVWLGQHPAPEVFDMETLVPFMHEFLGEQLPQLLAEPAQEAFWHFTYNCERCGFREHCAAQMRRTNDLSRLTNLSAHGKRHLVAAGVRTLPELDAFLQSPAADEVLGRCASLAGDRHYLEGRVAAFRTQASRNHGSATALPRGENVAVFLTLQREPLARSTYLAGALLHVKDGLEAIFSPEVRSQFFTADGKPTPWVRVAPTPDAVDALRAAFVRGLHRALADVHAFNAHRDWGDQLSLQVYAHTDRDREQLTELLLECLTDPALSQPAMELLLHFQCPDLINTDDPPDRPVPYPVIVLQNALTKMVALPIEVSYTLPETLAALGSPYQYTRKDYYHYPLGHGLRSEAIHAIWHQGKADRLPALAKEAASYLYAQRALLWALRKVVGDELFAWPPKFQLPPSLGLADPLLARLAFFVRYESVMQYLQVREARAEPQVVRVRLGLATRLRAVTDSVFEVIGENAMPMEEGGFPNWLLSRATPAGRRAQLEFRDYASRAKVFMKPSADVAMVGLQEVDEAGGQVRRVRVSYKTAFLGPPPAPGETFELQPRFTDFNSDRVIAFLQDVDRAGGSFFQHLLTDPAAASGHQPLPDPVRGHVEALEEHLGLSPSQLSAFRELTRRQLLAVWGPPGTGKTHFLASAILALAEAHATAQKPFRVLITAFTHAAIENLLKKVHQLAAARPASPLALGKLKAWQGDAPAGSDTIAEDRAARWFQAHPIAVVGGTVYAGIKASAKGQLPAFDLVVVDEASQVRVAEAAVPASLVAPDGRLVLAGDDLQLPPIVAGVYPEAAPGTAVLHRSVFEAVRSQLPEDSPVVAKLLENRRMNDVLTSYAATLLYGPDYCCFDDSVAARRLRLTPSPSPTALADACLDPTRPLTVVILDGLQATKQSPIEAALVADLVLSLRARLLDGTGTAYDDDRRFFRDGVFIVSPHRAQNRAIRQELAARRVWTSAPFVDTVDKMQGQEADVAIVSYGVADPEYALLESEFIYSLNRLNVAITRARTKSVVFLSRPLLSSLPRVVDNPDAERGLAFMRNLVEAVAHAGEPVTFALEDGVRATVYASGRTLDP